MACSAVAHITTLATIIPHQALLSPVCEWDALNMSRIATIQQQAVAPVAPRALARCQVAMAANAGRLAAGGVWLGGGRGYAISLSVQPPSRPSEALIAIDACRAPPLPPQSPRCGNSSGSLLPPPLALCAWPRPQGSRTLAA